jgi:hypothetical protein
MKQQIAAAALAAIVGVGGLSLGAARPAEARSGSRENTWRVGTYVGAAATGAALAKGKGTWGLIGAGATALSYSQWKKEVNRRHRRQRSARYSRRYYRRYR